MLGDGQRFVACARERVDDQEVQIASFHVGVELADGRNVLQAAGVSLRLPLISGISVSPGIRDRSGP